MTDRELLNMAFEAAENAYAPYSGLRVGAALECADGTVFTDVPVYDSPCIITARQAIDIDGTAK